MTCEPSDLTKVEIYQAFSYTQRDKNTHMECISVQLNYNHVHSKSFHFISFIFLLVTETQNL